MKTLTLTLTEAQFDSLLKSVQDSMTLASNSISDALMECHKPSCSTQEELLTQVVDAKKTIDNMKELTEVLNV